MTNRKKKLLAVVLSSVLSLSGLELGLRFYTSWQTAKTLKDAYEQSANPPAGQQVGFGHMVRPSPYHDIVYELKPGLDVIFEGARTRTNSRGWREGEIPIPKGSDTLRIVGIGDSYMFGWAVDESDRYLDLLEKRLNSAFGQARWETLAFAAPGYNLPMEVEVLKRYALAYDPDLIIYGYVGNDYCLPDFVIDRPSPRGPEWVTLGYLKKAFARVEQSADTGLGFLWRLDGRPTYEICDSSRAPKRYSHLVGPDNFVAALAQLNDIGAKHGVPIISVVPITDRFSPEKRAHAEHLDRRFEHVDMVDFHREVEVYLDKFGYQDVIRSPLVFGPHDVHPTKEGHKLTAKLIYDALVSRGVVERLLDNN